MEDPISQPQVPQPAGDELPAYAATSPPNPVERVLHTYQLTKGNGKPWLSLTMRSRAQLAGHLPYFIEGDHIEGTVELDLAKPDYLVAIVLSITGAVSPSTSRSGSGDSEGDGQRRFLEITETIWQASNTASPSFINRMRQREGDRLEGNHRYPFRVALPKKATYMEKEYTLPASFVERARASVAYSVIITVRRGALAGGDLLSTTIRYCPGVAPGPFSMLRSAACAQGTGNLVGPDGDPDGWKSLPPLSIRGDLFGSRFVQVDCTLSIAKPLSYLRGTFIPCHLTISCSDTQALALFSSPSAPVVRLLSYIVYQKPYKPTPSPDLASQKTKRKPDASYTTDARVVQNAVWWLPPPDTDSPSADADSGAPPAITLRGEIHLSAELKPPISVPEFALTYSVGLHPFKVAGFVPADAATKQKDAVLNGAPPLLTEPVEIATVYAPGPRPRACTPPSYEKGDAWPNLGLGLTGFL